MSIGNLRDQGNKGNNFPYQLASLQLLGSIESTLASGASTQPIGPMAADAFGRFRVSEPYTLGDYKHIYGLDSNFIDQVVNGGTVTFQPYQACARLATTGAANSSAIHQTKFYHQYLPGKSQLIYSTFNFYAANTGVTKRTGYFDDNNGVFLQQNGSGVISFIIRSNTSGAPVDTEIANQANWNIDPCNGSGPSGFNFNVLTTQILFIELQWLGVGRVRVGFVHAGTFIVAHEFYHDNVIPTVYMSNPNLPVRCEIVSSGSNPAAYFDQICSTVLSEGGYAESGQDWATLNTTLRAVAAGATTPILAIRLKTLFNTYDNRMIVRLTKYSVLSTTQSLSVRVVKLPNIASLTTGTVWVLANTNSGVEYNIGASAVIAPFDVIDASYVPASTSSKSSLTESSASTAKKNYIVQNYTSTDSEIYAVVVTNLGANSTDVGVAMQWREIY